MSKSGSPIVGLDIGTSCVRVVMAEIADDGEIEIIGIGEAESRGLRKGVIQHALSDPDLRPIWDYIRELEESGDGD